MGKLALGTALAWLALSVGASASPVAYNIDPGHTYPSFAADHNDGLSIWRGKFRSTKGTVTLDREAHSGQVNIEIDATSIDFGHDGMNARAKSDPALFDVGKYPTISYQGTFSKFAGDVPTEVDGQLTLHGVTKPVKLVINSFLCRPNRVSKKEVCGADAAATFNRADFGITFGQEVGFRMAAKIEIQVEAIKVDQ